jgi:hypothetical protein
VASQSAFSQSSEARDEAYFSVHLEDEVDSRDEEGVSRDFDGDSRHEEAPSGEQESGPSGSSTQKKRRFRGETDVPKEEPAPADRPVISPSGNE